MMNRKKLFQSTLESLKQSKCKEDFEVIVVDDGSDESERLEELASSYPFLKIIRIEQKNKWSKELIELSSKGEKEEMELEFSHVHLLRRPSAVVRAVKGATV